MLNQVTLKPRLRKIGSVSDSLNLRSYLVGGAVRDIVSGIRHLDWDITVEGNPSHLVHAMAKLWEGKVTSHPRFGTFVLELPNTHHIDFVTARKETYPAPGSLPVVSFSNLKDDLFRRDFTINALAIPLGGTEHGKVLDYYDGISDLRKGVLRVLHDKSFRDDPTRIFRLARFAGRGFKPEKKTESLALADRHFIKHLSSERLREELLAILSEKDPYPALKLLQEWSVLDYILPGIVITEDAKRLQHVSSLPERMHFLFSSLGTLQRHHLTASLRLPRKLKKELTELFHKPECKPALSGHDLIKLGYEPGPLFRDILHTLSSRKFTSRRTALRFLIDNFPKKR